MHMHNSYSCQGLRTLIVHAHQQLLIHGGGGGASPLHTVPSLPCRHLILVDRLLIDRSGRRCAVALGVVDVAVAPESRRTFACLGVWSGPLCTECWPLSLELLSCQGT